MGLLFLMDGVVVLFIQAKREKKTEAALWDLFSRVKKFL